MRQVNTWRTSFSLLKSPITLTINQLRKMLLKAVHPIYKNYVLFDTNRPKFALTLPMTLPHATRFSFPSQHQRNRLLVRKNRRHPKYSKSTSRHSSQTYLQKTKHHRPFRSATRQNRQNKKRKSLLRTAQSWLRKTSYPPSWKNVWNPWDT